MYRPYSNSQADSHPLRDVESLLRGLTQDFATSFNTGNYDQAAALFAGDGVLMPPRQDAAYGQKAVERLLRQLGDAGYSNLRLETMRVVHSSDMAMELGRFTVAVRQADGTLVPDHGRYVKVWRRLGAWLIIAESWSGMAQEAGDRAA
jgi:ketosteroid isomerase-like protein